MDRRAVKLLFLAPYDQKKFKTHWATPILRRFSPSVPLFFNHVMIQCRDGTILDINTRNGLGFYNSSHYEGYPIHSLTVGYLGFEEYIRAVDNFWDRHRQNMRQKPQILQAGVRGFFGTKKRALDCITVCHSFLQEAGLVQCGVPNADITPTHYYYDMRRRYGTPEPL